MSKGGRHFAWLWTSKSSSGRRNFAADPLITDLPREISLVYRLLPLNAYEPRGRVKEDAVVKQMVDSWGMQYAVIAGLRTETGPERLVIAYPNEKSLRDLIAAASIIAVGFSSREEAVASARASMPTAIYRQQMPEAIAGGETEGYRQRRNWAERLGEILGRLLVTSYSHFATTVIAIFFSRNAVSAVIRMALGSSA
jgi:hypothetical protein